MAWTDSRVKRSMITDHFAGTAVFDFNAPSDTYRLPLFNNTVVPDKDATSANSAYNAGTWLIAQEVIDTLNTNWIAKGPAITTMTVTNPGAGIMMVDCDDIAAAGNVTLNTFFGAAPFNDTKTTPVADPIVCFNYFGGTQTVTNNLFTAQVSTLGLFRGTV